MSKIGDLPIKINPNVKVEITKDTALISGSAGSIILPLSGKIKIEVQEDSIRLSRKRDDKKSRSMHGLMRTLLNNAVLGVQKPWTKILEVVGTGYRAKMQGEDVVFEVGYSHPVVFASKEGVKLSVEGKNKVIVSGVDKQLVGEAAHQIKSIKKPDPYKGKGIRYENEQIKLKPGKKAKGATGE